MRITPLQDPTKRMSAMPEMRRAKSGDHLRTERRPRSNTSGPTGHENPPKSASKSSSRPPSQIIGEKSINRHRMTTSADQTASTTWLEEQKITQEMFHREKSMEMIRREKSMDVRLESRLLMEREYRNSMTKQAPAPSSTIESHHVNRVRSTEKTSPGPSPPQSLSRSSASNGSSRRDNNNTESPRPTNGNTPLPHDGEMRRGGSVTAAREGMSYRQVFGLQSSDYLFNVTPPNYTRHRRFSDSDTESLHNFNFIHKVISHPPSMSNTPLHQSTQQLSGQQSTPQQQQQTEDSKSKVLNMQPKKWMKKVRRKSEDNPKRKLVAQLSNK